MPTREELERHTTALLRGLQRELNGAVTPDNIDAVGRSHFDRLMHEARVFDYIPLLVYRSTKDDVHQAA